MKKVLITGGSGLLGINWAFAIKNNYNVVLGLHNREVVLDDVGTVKIDIENIQVFRDLVKQISPDIIIHAAGMTNVDQCETDEKMAEYLNCQLPENVASVCNEYNIKLAFISTDHLYDGSKENVTEKEATCPVNVYGKTKLKGENVSAKACSNSLIIRTNFFGWGGPYKRSFSDWVINNLREGNKIKLFDDVFYTPILIDRLASVSMKLIESGQSGVVNIVGDDRVSKYDFANKIVTRFSLPQHLIERAKMTDSDFLTVRPKDMSLSNKYAQTLLKSSLGNIDEYISELKRQEESGRAKKVLEAFL